MKVSLGTENLNSEQHIKESKEVMKERKVVVETKSREMLLLKQRAERIDIQRKNCSSVKHRDSIRLLLLQSHLPSTLFNL